MSSNPSKVEVPKHVLLLNLLNFCVMLEDVSGHPLDCHPKSSLFPSQRNPQSSSIKQLEQIIHRLVQTTKRDGEGLIFHVTSQSAHIWRVSD